MRVRNNLGLRIYARLPRSLPRSTREPAFRGRLSYGVATSAKCRKRPTHPGSQKQVVPLVVTLHLTLASATINDEGINARPAHPPPKCTTGNFDRGRSLHHTRGQSSTHVRIFTRVVLHRMATLDTSRFSNAEVQSSHSGVR